MSDIRLEGVTQALRHRRGGGQCRPRGGAWRVRHHPGAERLGQDDAAAADRRPQPADGGPHLHRRARRHRSERAGAQYRAGVPVLRAVPAHDGAGERAVPPRRAQDQRRDRAQPGARGAEAGAPRGLAGSPAVAAFRRPAAAGGAGACGRLQARHPAARRAARRARPQAARGAAGRAEAASAPARRDDACS